LCCAIDFNRPPREHTLRTDASIRMDVQHDTTMFADNCETEGHRAEVGGRGILAGREFRLKEQHENDNGLVVLERTRS
jgi:hypothetical protein